MSYTPDAARLLTTINKFSFHWPFEIRLVLLYASV